LPSHGDALCWLELEGKKGGKKKEKKKKKEEKKAVKSYSLTWEVTQLQEVDISRRY